MKYVFDFKGKNVCITGSARGIGRGVAEGFGSYGANLILVDIEASKKGLQETKQIVENTGGKATIFTANLSQVAEIEQLVQKMRKEFAVLDVLINNHGITRKYETEDYKEEDYDATLDTNLKGYFFLCSRIAKNYFIPQKYGKIVNTASMAALRGVTRSCAYSASKGGVKQITMTLACEWAKYNIQVNAIAPGYTNTKMASHIDKNSEWYRTIMYATPMKRFGEIEDLVGAYLFLSSQMSNYITGHTLPVDGGACASFV
jgi:NAD(P)-dependent dehydrogenase (short-subunit alcohol dehydrogenase family)